MPTGYSCDWASAFGHVFVLNGPGGSLCKYRLGTRCTALGWEYPELSLEELMKNKMNHGAKHGKMRKGKSAHHQQSPEWLRQTCILR